jgi:ParB family chromosome partitioning protein
VLEDLTESVRQHGVLMPLLFRQDAALEANVIVAGERRFEAAKIAGLTTIPAILVEGNTAEIALVENLLRQDLTAVEEAEALQRLKDEQKYTDEQLGAIIGKARTTLNEALSLNKLPQEIRDECRADRTITKSTLITIARKKQARAMTTAYNAYKAKQRKGKATRTKKDPNDPQAIVDMLDKAMTKLQSTDTSAWTDEAKASFQTSLANLKIEITNHQAL